MKTIQYSERFTGLSLVLLIWLMAASFTNPPEDLQKLTAETTHSTLLFSVPIASGITRITGKYNDYSIDLDYVDKDFTKSVLSATIQAASIDTGINGRDEHLRSPDFFDTETYPEITFRSDRIERTDTGYTAIGDFTMHGVTKELEIPFKITGVDGENTIGISARMAIDRTVFGVGNDFKHTSIENFISNTIDVEIDFWTKRRKEPKQE